MGDYIIKRLFTSLISLLLVICVTFLLMNTVPGGPFLSAKALSPQALASLEAKYGLDKPLPVQLKNYIVHIFRGDFGVSLKMQKNRPVITIIKEMFPVSAKLALIGMAWASLAGIALGSLAAYKRGTFLDSLLQVTTTIGIAVPDFISATVLLVVLAGGVFHIFPSAGLNDGVISYILPCFTIGLIPMCSIARYTRSSMLDVLNKEYIKTARAYGHPGYRIIFKHALRNALIPVITYLGPITAALLTGDFIIESVFSIPGLGRYFVQSITNRDYPLIMGVTIFFAALIVLVSFILDIIYKIIDPRIELGEEEH